MSKEVKETKETDDIHLGKQYCPLTGLRLYQPEDWHFHGQKFEARIYLLGEHVIVWKPMGIFSAQEALDVADHIRKIVYPLFEQKIEFYLFIDYSQLDIPLISNRLSTLNHIKEISGYLEGIYFYGMKKTLRTIVQLAVQISGFREKFFVCKDYAHAIAILRKKQLKKEVNEADVLSLYPSEDVQKLMQVMGEIVWRHNYQSEVPKLPPEHPLHEFFNVVDVIRKDLFDLEKQNNEVIAMLKKTNEDKSNFLAQMSHEIRTPLGGIIGATELLEKTQTSAEQKKILEILKVSANTLLDGVNDVLDISRLELGGLRLKSSNVNLLQLCQELVDMFKPACEKKGLQISLRTHDIPNVVKVDALRLKQVLANLLQNAIKFTDNGFVELICESNVDSQNFDGQLAEIYFCVKDSGIGIDAQTQKKIFEKFTQLNFNYGGSGLGLHIASQLVALLSGHSDAPTKLSEKNKIQVSSSVAEGSSFSFTLSLPFSDSTNSIVEKNEEPKEILFYGHILVADDDEANRFVLAAFLKNLGCSVVSVTTGALALEAVEKEYFDMAFFDCQMPVMSGLQAIKILRTGKQPYADMPVVAVTAYENERSEELTSDYGFDVSMEKPLRFEKLIVVLKNFLPYKEKDSTKNNVHDYVDEDFLYSQLELKEKELFQLNSMLQEKEIDFEHCKKITHKLKGFYLTFEHSYNLDNTNSFKHLQKTLVVLSKNLHVAVQNEQITEVKTFCQELINHAQEIKNLLKTNLPKMAEAKSNEKQ